MPKKLTIENTLPHLIDALWHHPDCPKWLQDDLWDAINNRIDGTEMTPTYWAAQLESARRDEPGEHDARYGFPHEREAFENGEAVEWPAVIAGEVEDDK